MAELQSEPPQEPPTLVDTVEAEQHTPNPVCAHAQDGVPDNVCLRDTGHDGPHVAQVAGTWLQWEV